MIRDYISFKHFALGLVAVFTTTSVLLFAPMSTQAQSVVISELMYHPLDGTNPVDGDLYEFVEIYNPNPVAFDLSAAEFTKGISYTFADPTLIPPEGFLVLNRNYAAFSARYPSVTNTAPGEYSGKLSNGGEKITLKDRTGTTLFSVDYSDAGGWPVVWTSTTEYATRVVQVPAITLPNNGAVIELADLQSNMVDTVAYTNTSPWPTSLVSSLELILPLSDNSLSTNWRLCTIVGTPGTRNSALMDTDQDTMVDDWEQNIVEASGGTYTSVLQILTTDDFDEDGILNIDEWHMGTDPISNDTHLIEMAIELTNNNPLISFKTIKPAPEDYEKYDSRSYTLEGTDSLYPLDEWLSITNYTDLPGYGQTVSYTNQNQSVKEFYRYQIRLIPLRE